MHPSFGGEIKDAVPRNSCCRKILLLPNRELNRVKCPTINVVWVRADKDRLFAEEESRGDCGSCSQQDCVRTLVVVVVVVVVRLIHGLCRKD